MPAIQYVPAVAERGTGGGPGTAGPWTLSKRLGIGGMGEVFLGHHGPELAAVKIVAPALADDPEFMSRFRREVEVCRRVRGPQVAELIGSGLDASPAWFAVRYVPGPTLRQAIQDHGPMRGDQLTGFSLAVALALRQIHAAGVVHRDLKPANIILAEDTPVLIDFGIASAIDATAITLSGRAIGSPGWMAPEQVLGHPVGTPADIFAWGAVVTYAATGHGPFGAGRPEALAYRVVHDEPDIEGVPEDLRGLVRSALSLRSESRPTVGMVLEGLGKADDDVATVIASTWRGAATRRLVRSERDHGGAPEPNRAATVSGRRRRAALGVTVVTLMAGLAAAVIQVEGESTGQAAETYPRSDGSATSPPLSRARTPAAAPARGSEPQAQPTTLNRIPSVDLLQQARRWALDCAGNGEPKRVDLVRYKDADFTGDGVTDRIAVASCGLSTGSGWPVEIRLFNGTTGFSSILVSSTYEPPRTAVTSIKQRGTLVTFRGRALIGAECSACASGRWFHRVSLRGGRVRQLGTMTRSAERDDPVGYGPVKIGMTIADLLATHAVDDVTYRMVAGGSVCVNEFEDRVEAIYFGGDMNTSQGIGEGSSAADFYAAYPAAHRISSNAWLAPITADVSYWVAIGSNRVSQLVMASNDQECFE